MAGISFTRTAATTAEWAAQCRLAERAGLAGLATGDTYGNDAFVDAAVALALTERLPVRIGVALPSRTPLQTAWAAASLASLAGVAGRFSLGLGVGSPFVNEALHGMPYGPPLARLRAFHACVAGILRAPAGTPAAVETPTFRASATGAGLDAEALPILLGVTNPGALRLAGEVAEGAIVHLLTPLEEIGPRLAAAVHGREPGRSFATGAGVICSLDDDEHEALRRARAELAAAFTLPPFAPRLAAHAGADAAAHFAELAAAGRLADAAAALPEQTVRSFVLVTTPAGFRDAIAVIPTETVSPLAAGIFAGGRGAELGFTPADGAATQAALTRAVFGDLV